MMSDENLDAVSQNEVSQGIGQNKYEYLRRPLVRF